MRNPLIRMLVLATLPLLAGACANLDASGSTSSSSQVLISTGPVRTSRDYLDHYVCANERPLACECIGRLARSGDLCECRCPLVP